MAHIAYDRSDSDSSVERTALCAAARMLITDSPDPFMAEGGELEEAYSIEAVRTRLAERVAKATAVALGQPDPPMDWPRGKVPPRPSRRPASRQGLTIANEQAARVDFAFMDLHGRDRPDDERGLLGARRKRSQQVANARRAVLVCTALLDPDAEEYLAGITTLAGCAWLDGDGQEATALGPGTVYYTWNVQALSMLRRALIVLGVQLQPLPPKVSHATDDETGKAVAIVAPEVENAINRFAQLLTRCRAVHGAWNESNERLSRVSKLIPEPLSGYKSLPESITSFAALSFHKRNRRERSPVGVAMWMSWYDALDDLTFAVRRWRSALDAASMVLGSVERWMDDPRLPPVQRWTAGVRGELGTLGGLIHRMTVGDTPESLDTVAFEKHTLLVAARLKKLKSVRDMRPPAQPVGNANEFVPEDAGTHEAAPTPEFPRNAAPGASPQSPPEPSDDEYRPAAWFRKGMAARLRKAANKDRKSKRVATRVIDGVTCYSVADVRRWWSNEALRAE